MNIKGYLVGFAFAAFAIPGMAEAATFTESVQFGSGPADFNNSTGMTAGPGGNQLYYFDSNGGHLNSITLSYSYSISATITITNSSATTASGTARIQSGAQFESNNGQLNAVLNNDVNNYVDPTDGNKVMFGASTLTPIAADVRGNQLTYTLAPGGFISNTSSGAYNRPNYTVSDAASLAAFSRAGGGTFTPLFTTLTGLVVNNSGGNVTAMRTATGQGNLVISYDYTSGAPEPATWGLMIAGFGGAGGVLRRRRTVRRTGSPLSA